MWMKESIQRTSHMPFNKNVHFHKGHVRSLLHTLSSTFIHTYTYTAVCKTFEPLIYISIYIYGVHCGKVLILENVPGRKKILNIQPQEGNNTQLHVYPNYPGWK